MQARMIFYLRCAAYLRPLPRTHQQQKQLLAQTHSRGRAMLALMTKIILSPCLGDNGFAPTETKCRVQ